MQTVRRKVGSSGFGELVRDRERQLYASTFYIWSTRLAFCVLE